MICAIKAMHTLDRGIYCGLAGQPIWLVIDQVVYSSKGLPPIPVPRMLWWDSYGWQSVPQIAQ